MSWFDYRRDADRGLETEIMASDRLRAAVLGTVFLVASAALALLGTQAAGFRNGPLDFLSRYPFGPTALLLAVLGAYEWGYRTAQGVLLRKGLRLPLPPRLFNAAVEISLPTLILYWLSSAVPPSTALNLPPVFLYFFFLALATLRLDPWLALFTGALAGAEYAGLAWFLLPPGTGSSQEFLGVYLSKSGLLFVTGGILAFVSFQVRTKVIRLLETQAKQTRTAAIFGQHVSPAVMEKLLAQDAGPVSEIRQVTVLFLDIRNFTGFSESRSPEEVVAYLNRLFAFMVDEVNAHGGIVNKFLGDGFLAVFGAPLDDGRSERSAVLAALGISDRLRVALAEGLEPTRIGIGLHAGPVVTGNVGSNLRQEYTIIGDVVNLASRIESHTKAVGAEILASAATWESALRGSSDLPAAQALGPVTVKGRETPVDLVRLR